MSWQATAWAQRVKVGNPCRKAVLIAMANYANDGGASIHPSVSTICDITELSERAVQGHLKELVNLGFLIITAEPSGKPKIYRVPLGQTPAGDAPPQNLHPRRLRHKPPQEMHPTPAGDAPNPFIQPLKEPFIVHEDDDLFSEPFKPIGNSAVENEPPKRSSSIPPKRQDVVNYFEELMAANPEDEADAFMDYWAARDWKNSRGKMKDWEATVRTWKRNQIEYGKWQEKKIVLIPVEGVDYKIKYWQEGDTCGTHWNIDDSGPFMEPIWKAKKLAEMQGGKK